MVEGCIALDIAAGLADHDAEFDFPIRLLRVARDHHWIIRAADARNRLGEEDWLGRRRNPRFARVIGVIESDREEFAYASDWRADARFALDKRQRARIDRLQACNALGRYGYRRQIRKDSRQIADVSDSIQNARLFAPLWS